jgi:hypothetical protein
MTISATQLEARPTTTAGAAVAGLAGPLLFTTVFTAHGASLGSAYSVVQHPVSALDAFDPPRLQQANFLGFAGCLAWFTIGLHRGLAQTPGGCLGPGLLGLASGGLVLAAALPLEMTPDGRIVDPGGHMVSGVTFFRCSALALLALSRRLARDPGWADLAGHARRAGMGALAGFVVIGGFAAREDAPLHDLMGLLQRTVLWTTTFPMLLRLAWRLHARGRG